MSLFNIEIYSRTFLDVKVYHGNHFAVFCFIAATGMKRCNSLPETSEKYSEGEL